MILVVPVLGDALQRRSCTRGEDRKLSDPLSAVLPLCHRRKPEQKRQHLLLCWLFEGSAGCCMCEGAAQLPAAAAELLRVALQRDLATRGASTVCGLTEGSPGWKPNTSSANDRCGKALQSCRELRMKGIK